jgi:ribA/ribD-fused uncharacterized protein
MLEVKKMEDKEIRFWMKGPEEFQFLSNFYPSPFSKDFIRWETVEHYFQAHKCLKEEDFNKVWRAKYANDAKRLGHSVEVKSNWNDIKDQIMWDAIRLKFKHNEDLREMLLATDGYELVHYAPWGDDYWGVDKDGKGQNKQGKILMIVRKELKDELSNKT